VSYAKEQETGTNRHLAVPYVVDQDVTLVPNMVDLGTPLTWNDSGREPAGGPLPDPRVPNLEAAVETDRDPHPTPQRLHAPLQTVAPAAGSPPGLPAGRILRVAEVPSTGISTVASPGAAA
jgi:hypothetical protein